MRRRYIIIIAVALLFSWGLIYVLQMRLSGKLMITAPSKTPNNASVNIKITSENDFVTKFSLKPGTSHTVTLKRGKVRVDGEAGNLKSVDIVMVNGWRATTRLTTPYGEQRAIQKLGSNSGSCPLVIGDQAFSSACSSDDLIYRHTAVNNDDLASKQVLFNGRSFDALAPYSQGYLGFASGNTEELLYIDPATESTKTIQVPNDVSALGALDQPSLITSSDPSSQHFAIVFRKFNKVYIFKNTEDASPTDLKLEKSVNFRDLKHTYNFQMRKDTLVLFQGNADHYEGSDQDAAESSKQAKDYYDEVSELPQYIYEYRASGEQTRRIQLEGGIAATSGVTKLANDLYAMRTNFDVNLYHYQDGKLEFVFGLSDVTSFLALQDKTYFVIEGTVYVVEPKDHGLFRMQSLFSSDKLRVSGVTYGSSGIIFTALSARTGGRVLDVFRLLDTQQITPPFEEQLSSKELARYITGYDYDDKTVVFFLGAAGSAGPSRAQLLEGLKNILADLKIDVGGRKIELGSLN